MVETPERIARSRAQRSWAVTAAASTTPLLVVASLAVCFACVELSVRTEPVRRQLLPPSVGSPSRPFEIQLARLNAFVRREGGPDCVFVGSSLVLTGVDPEVFDAAYERRAGRRIRCFNLGVPGMSASDVGALAGILLEDYEPSLIVYGATFRDFSTRVAGPGLKALAWVQYRNGSWSADGWLIDHSDAYRYYLTYRDWMDREQRRLMSRPFSTADNGFWRHAPRTAPVTLEQQLDNVKDDFSTLMRDGIAATHLAGLDAFLRLRKRGLRTIVVEMPGPTALAAWLRRRDDYRRFITRIRRETQRHGAPFWANRKKVPRKLIPDGGWNDLYHMNTTGAEIFSRWLGDAIAGAFAASPAADRHARE
jgi:hypothetical protein